MARAFARALRRCYQELRVVLFSLCIPGQGGSGDTGANAGAVVGIIKCIVVFVTVYGGRRFGGVRGNLELHNCIGVFVVVFVARAFRRRSWECRNVKCTHVSVARALVRAFRRRYRE